ncbi:MAG: M81 family metallopeptidase [Clostridia bacterium]|nr:M81 family metallopeptidase [Clostridia bacterium]
MGKKKILVLQFRHETNSFCPALSDGAAFRNLEFDMGEDAFSAHRGSGTEMGAFLDVLEGREDIELIPVAALTANPAGPVTEDVYLYVLENLQAAMLKHSPIDGVLLCLHGAMVAQKHPDGEGDLLEDIRRYAGWDIPVVATLDLHANVTEKMAHCATALIPYERYPHTDSYETGRVAAQLFADALDGKITPVTVYRRVPYLLPLFPDAEPPMCRIYAFAAELKERYHLMELRFTHGFFLSDIEEMGMAVLAVSDGDENAANAAAEELAALIRESIPDLKRHYPDLEDVLDEAEHSPDTPFVIADASDNPGAGGFGDTTHILRRILERGMQGAVIATIVDAESVERCIEAGVGAFISLKIGGKSDASFSGGPLAVSGYIKRITDGTYTVTAQMDHGSKMRHGKTVLLEVEGNAVILSSYPRQPWDLGIFTSHGIMPEQQKILVTKSAIHYRAAYGTIAKKMVAVALPGYSTPVPDGIPFQHLKG